MKSDLKAASSAIAHVVLSRYPHEAARLLEAGKPMEVAALLSEEPAQVAAKALMSLTPDIAAAVLGATEPTRAVALLGLIEPDRSGAMLARLDDTQREALLGGLPELLAGEIRDLQKYSPDCAGGMMSPRATAFRPEDTVGDAIRILRTLQRKRIQDVFLIDQDARLVGAIPLQEIVLSDKNERLGALSVGVPRSVAATMSRNEVVDQLSKNPSGSLPVVDYDGRLLGVLRQAELLGAAQRNAAAQALTMVGASRDERALSPFTFSVRKRLPWLMVNLLTAFLASFVVGLFEDTIARFTALAVLLPVVAGQSGNTGAQALAVTMRGLALREARTRHWFRVAVKEVAAGATNGVAIATTTGLAVWLWSSSTGLGMVIALSMVLSMTAAGLAGALIPMVLTALRQDPAQSSSIVLTTVTDVAGFLSFLGIATALSGLL